MARISRRHFLGQTAAGAALAGGGILPGATAARADGPSAGPVRPTRLTTEYAADLLGTDVARPRFGWVPVAGGHGAVQQTYRVRVSSTLELARAGQGDVWDSGAVVSARCTGIEYDGSEALRPRTRYHWTVELTDAMDRSTGRSGPAWFETALMTPEAWTADWVAPLAEDRPDLDFDGASWIWSPGATTGNAPPGTRWFRGRLALPTGASVTGAILVMTADDDFTAWVDGDQALHAPQQTDGWRSGRFVDLTDALAEATGEIVVAVRATNRPGPSVNPGGLIGKLMVTTQAGELLLITDGSWRSSDEEIDGWTDPVFDDSGWDDVVVLAPYGQGPWGSGVTISVPEPPAPLLRREFTLTKPVARARVYASGLAYHELWLNGERLGDAVLDPGFTDYDDTVLYVTYDVTDLLADGANALGAELGRGFFAMTTPNVWRWHQPPWLAEPQLRLQLMVDHPDGSTTTIGSDDAWRTIGGPTTSNSQYEGESYDARREQPGWTEAGFDDAAWASVVSMDAPSGRLRAQDHEPIRVTERVEASWTRVGDSWVADFGRTMAGWARLTVDAPAGSTVRLTYGERVRADGTVEAVNGLVHSSRFQVDEFTSDGSGPASWEAKFAYKGFRYVQVDGLTEAPDDETLVAAVVHSDVPRVATFSCSSGLLEQCERAMSRTILNNLHGIPTDTPKYEKNGWTGDAQVGAPTMATTFDLRRFFTKWLGDLRDSQLESGQIPVIVPSGGWGYQELAPSPEWTTVYPYVLRQMHRWYGDERILGEHWEPVLAYVDWELGRLQDGLAVTALGDYLSPGTGGNPPEDTRLTASAYLHRALICTAEVGELVGADDEALRLRTAAAGLRDRLNEEFLDPTSGHYRTARDPEYRQTSNAVPLAFGLVPADQVGSVVNSLVADIRNRGNHLNTGNLGTSVLLPVLTEHGHSSVAADIALQTTYPSWGHWFENGADTMWEFWSLPGRSRDHYFQGTVVQWLMEDVAGLRSLDAGWQRMRVRPHARARLTHARLSVETVRGTASSSWRQRGRGFDLDAEVPVGATAEVHVPGDDPRRITVDPSSGASVDRVEGGYVVFVVGSGHWSFRTVTPAPA
ncbi:MAG: Bacterial alpha-L-rhamnosidase [Propionibacteriales bacterium]|nr:Bacterial alpha-L-rhamnosidase [Propionibacteriales bacterium]